MLTVLAIAAFVAGLTGSWSPCGLSMLSTLGPTGHTGGRPTTAAACAAFVPGALAGGVVTFGLVALAGSLLGGGPTALGAGALVALVAALLEVRGTRIVPQIRRQVPEHWRRVLPLPLAAVGYGVLLGLGFTTFVLTFAVPALAGICLAVGQPAVGLAVGLAFGAGRALPVVVLAPLAAHPVGIRAGELMAERPGILRGFRAADALAMAACALVLGAGVVQAADERVTAQSAADPTVAGGDLAWRTPDGAGMLRRAGNDTPLAGTHPALGGDHLAVHTTDGVVVTRRSDGAAVRTLPIGGTDPLAVSDDWVAVRSATSRGDRMDAWSLADGTRRTVMSVRAPAQLGRPSLDGNQLVFHVAGRASRIVEADLAAGRRRNLRTGERIGFTNPSVHNGSLLYVRTSPYSQSLQLGPRTRPRADGTILRIAPNVDADAGHERGRRPHRRTNQPARPAPRGPEGTVSTLWTTALTSDTAYVTRLRQSGGGGQTMDILELDLP